MPELQAHPALTGGKRTSTASLVSQLTKDPHYKLPDTKEKFLPDKKLDYKTTRTQLRNFKMTQNIIRAAHPAEVTGYLKHKGGALAAFRQQQIELRNERRAERDRKEAEIDRIHRENRTIYTI